MLRYRLSLMGLSVLASASLGHAAESKVTVENAHLCCNACVKGAEKAITSVQGVTAKSDAKAGKITITAPDEASAQKAVDALCEAGYHGKTTGAKMQDAGNVKAGNVKSVSISGVHNCCKKCTTAINEAIKSVSGTKTEVPAKVETFTVTGDFDAQKLVQAFYDAGFHVKVDEVK